MRMPFAAGGSGSSYIMGLMDADWRPKLKEEEARAMIKRWLSFAMARDGSSGGVIRTMSIKESGVDEDVTLGNKLPFGPL